MAEGRKDRFANIMTETITLSAANTLTFEEIDVGLNLFDKFGMLIHKIQFDPTSVYLSEMVAVTDSCRYAVVQDNSITTLSISERSVIDVVAMGVSVSGTAGSHELVEQPFERDYTTLPGGGILVAPKPLYFAMVSGGFANPLVATLRLYFTIVKMKDADYLELLESRRFFG